MSPTLHGDLSSALHVFPRPGCLLAMDHFTPWLRQSSWERRQAWAKQRCTRHSLAIEEEMPSAPTEALEFQPSFLEDGFFRGSSSNKIESWLEECSSSVEAFPEGISALSAHGSCSNGTSFEDDLSLGAEATLLLDKDRAESRWPYLHLNLDHSLASSAISGSTNKTSSSISEVLERCEVDAETVLSNLGFIEEETRATSWIPARFFSIPSQAQGIDYQLFLRAQVQRLEMEDPCLMLASRFKQVQTLAVTADAFFCLYSYVSKTPVQKIAPTHLFWDFPHVPASWNIPPKPEALSPLQRLQNAISKMCLYTSPREGGLSRASNVQSSMSRLQQIVWEVMEKIRKDRLHLDVENVRKEAYMLPTGGSFCQSNMGSVSSETTVKEAASMGTSCFCCDAPSQLRKRRELEPWLSPCTDGPGMSYQGLYHFERHSPQGASDESSGESESSTPEEEDCMNTSAKQE